MVTARGRSVAQSGARISPKAGSLHMHEIGPCCRSLLPIISRRHFHSFHSFQSSFSLPVGFSVASQHLDPSTTMPEGGASFRPWSSTEQGTASLGETLAQIQAERGHFRNITEEGLRAEIAAEENGQASQSASGDEEDSGQDGDARDGRRQPTTRQELYAIREELTRRAQEAHQDVLVTLDMVSLLQTTYTPAQAATTVSPAAKAIVPLSSLGADLWARTPTDPARDAQDSLIATNVRAKYLSESADSLLSAASRLEDNVRKETQYWDQVLDISAKGWNVSRIPGQKQRLLGVHFGLSGSASDSTSRNIAALIPDDEGNIKLERGVGSRPKAVRAIVKRGSQIVGSSKLPVLLDTSETTLQARIRHARDSIFDEELFREMVRETRTLLARGVTMRGSTIVFEVSETESPECVELELVSLDEDNSLPFECSRESDHLAQATLLAARLLLNRAHREKIKKKSLLPPPMMPAENKLQPLLILRPILTMLQHSSHVLQINAYLDKLNQLLTRVGLPTTINTARVALPMTPRGVVDTESFLDTLLQPLSAEASIGIDSFPPFKLATGTSLQDDVGFTFAIIRDGRSYPWDCVADLVEETNQWLPDTIHRFISLKTEHWMFQQSSGHLVSKTDGAHRSAFVDLDGSAGTIELKMGKEKASWSLNGDSAEQGSIVDALLKWTKD